jgi:hypothetical protein
MSGTKDYPIFRYKPIYFIKGYLSSKKGRGEVSAGFLNPSCSAAENNPLLDE